ncbi:MAG: efflux RND transporter periplasmic adaptor subunit [Pirellulales bacterium]
MSGKRIKGWLMTLVVCGGGIAAAAYTGILPLGKSKGTAAPSPAAAAPAKAPEAIAVTVAQATPRTVERRVRIVGTLAGFEEIEISPLVDGQIRRVLHDVGDVVAPGEPLVEIDDTDFRLAVQEMGRALELELSRLGVQTVPDASFDVGTLSAVIRARLVEQNAAQTFERYKSLIDRNAITKDDYEKHELNYDVAKLDTKQRIIEAEQSLASIRHRQAILETAHKRLADTRVLTPAAVLAAGSAAPQIALVSAAVEDPSTVRSTFAYTVAERLVSEGEIVRASPPTKLFRLVVESPLKLQAAVPERFAGQVKVGQTVDLGVESWPGRKIAGLVVRVSPTVDTANRTFQVEIAVRNEDRSIKPGSFATASILIGADNRAVTVPEEAIIRFAGVTKLFTVSGDAATAIPVELGSRLEVPTAGGATKRWVEVIGQLPPAARVVTSGHAQLADGTKVRVREELAAAANASPAAPQMLATPNEDVREARAPFAAPRKEAR